MKTPGDSVHIDLDRVGREDKFNAAFAKLLYHLRIDAKTPETATVGIGDALDVVGKIPWRHSVQASVGEHS